MDGFLNDIWYPLHDAWHHHALLRIGVYASALALLWWFRRPIYRWCASIGVK